MMSKESGQALKDALQIVRRHADHVQTAQFVMLGAILDTLLRIEDKLDRVTAGGNATMTVSA